MYCHDQQASSFKPRIMSLKWLSLSKLQKKIQTCPLQAGLQDELFSASEMLLSSIQVRTNLTAYSYGKTVYKIVQLVLQNCCKTS